MPELRALKIRGPFRGPGGYDHHTREFARELSRRGVAVQLAEINRLGSPMLPREARDPWFESLSRPVDARITLHSCLPDQVELDARRLNVNFTMFEATSVPQGWAELSRDHDLLILPTLSSLRAWSAAGVPESKLRICPLGVSASAFRAGVPPLPLRLEDGRPVSDFKVRLLNVSEVGPRKNLPGLLRVWIRATSATDDAVLVLKLGAYSAGSIMQFAGYVRSVERELGRTLHDAAPVHVLYDLLPDADMPRVFAAATHYISMSFGEGWDLPMVEAAASGLKLIAPDHSAYQAYLNSRLASMIPAREAPAVFGGGDGTGRYFQDASWWLPDEDAAVQLIRAAVAGTDITKESARDHVLANFTWERATQRLIEILEEL